MCPSRIDFSPAVSCTLDRVDTILIRESPQTLFACFGVSCLISGDRGTANRTIGLFSAHACRSRPLPPGPARPYRRRPAAVKSALKSPRAAPRTAVKVRPLRDRG